MYEVAQVALTTLLGDPHSIPLEIMAALEEIRSIGERSLQAVRDDHRLDGVVPFFTVFIPHSSQPQDKPQPQPHP